MIERRNVIQRMRRKTHAIQHHDPRRAQRMRQRGIRFPPLDHHTRTHKPRANDKPNGRAQFGRNPAALDAELHKENDAQKQGQPAHPGEEFRSHELFERKARRRCACWCRAWLGLHCWPEVRRRHGSSGDECFGRSRFSGRYWRWCLHEDGFNRRNSRILSNDSRRCCRGCHNRTPLGGGGPGLERLNTPDQPRLALDALRGDLPQ